MDDQTRRRPRRPRSEASPPAARFAPDAPDRAACPGLESIPLVVTMAAGPQVLRVSGRDVAPGANIRVAATGLTAGFTGDLVWDDADVRPLRASLPTAPAASA